MKKLVIVFCLFSLALNEGVCLDTVVVRDLRAGWLTTEANNHWIPVSDLQGIRRVVVQLDSLEKDGLLKICSGTPADLWLGSSLLPRRVESGCSYFSAEDLALYFNEESYLLTISSENSLSHLVTEVVMVRDDEIEKSGGGELIIKERDSFSDFYILAVLILLVILSVMKLAFPVKYTKLIRNPFSSSTGSSNIEDNYSVFFGLDNLFSILFFSLILSLNLLYIEWEFSVLPQGLLSFQDLLLSWLRLGGVVALLIICKYIGANIIASLFQWRGIPNVQVQDYVNVFSLLSVAGILLASLDFSFSEGRDFLVKLSWFLFLIMSLIFQIWLYFKIVRFYSHKKILIISYLCTTEFLPGFLTVAWLMKFI